MTPAEPVRPEAEHRQSSLLEAVYNGYARRDGGLLKRLYLRLLGSQICARLLFGIGVEKQRQACYFDLTTVLLRGFLKRRLRDNPDSRLLEIGTGAYAILSCYASRWAERPIDGVDNDRDRVESSQRHVKRNNLNCRIWQSDLFAQVEKENYDLIFWNLPYYRDPESFLPGLFGSAGDHLTIGGELVIGYNSKPLPRAVVSHCSEPYFDRLELVNIVTFSWNLHEILVFRKPTPGSHRSSRESGSEL